MARPSDWRDQAATDLVVRAVTRIRPSGQRALVVEDRFTRPDEALVAEAATVARWNRRAFGGRAVAVRPPTGPYDLILLRMPRAKIELEMAGHMLASVAAPGGRLLLYGAKDEGIGSAPSRIEALFDSCEALEVGGHCRVWSFRLRAAPIVPVRSELSEWETRFDPGFGLGVGWLSYPGVFAHGELDAGTRLLAESLTPAPRGSQVLDFGAGTGVLGALQARSNDGVSVDLIDIDAFAVEAARENVPEADAVVGDGLRVLEDRTYDRIVSNPPIHLGKAESLEALSRLLGEAYRVLSKKGSMWLVVQKRLALRPRLAESFRDVTVRGEDEVFRVWEGRRPIYRGKKK